ncbi:ABC-type branched-subunit amino acid transport system ATPase component [Bradyrhizobium sp. LB9.1b]
MNSLTFNATPVGRPALSCVNVSARYGRITVVSDVTLDVTPGEMVAVLGANGAGKSSLLGSIAGTVSGSGRIDIKGQQVGSYPSHKRATSGLSLVPEQRRNVFAAMSVKENIELGLRLLPIAERDDQRDFIMGLFPILKERQSAGAGMLSGGEQQMLAISLALGRKPDVMILDEPTQGLAPAVFDTLQHAFDALKNRGLAMILAEQNVPFAARVADRYVILSQGSIVREGPGSDLSNPEDIAEVFLGSK